MLTRGRLFHIGILFLIGGFAILLVGSFPGKVRAGECICNDDFKTSADTAGACDLFCSDKNRNPQGVKSFRETPAGQQTIELKNPLGKTSTFEQVLDSITKFLIQIGAAIVVVVILVAGFQYMTAGGNAEKVTTAHKTLTYALVGYGIIIVARGLVIVLRKILGG